MQKSEYCKRGPIQHVATLDKDTSHLHHIKRFIHPKNIHCDVCVCVQTSRTEACMEELLWKKLKVTPP